MQSSEFTTVIYTIKDSHLSLPFKTKDGKTHRIQHKELIGVLMRKSEFKKRRLKGHFKSLNNRSIFFSSRKIVVNNNSSVKADLCRQGFIRLGLNPEPDYIYKVPLNEDITWHVPVVESRKKLTFINDKREKEILLALVGKTLVCTGNNTFKILDK
jgi:hypothetical protein